MTCGLKIRALSSCIFGAVFSCGNKNLTPDTSSSFDGRWEAKLASTATKRPGENTLLFDCQHLTGEVLNFVVNEGKGILFVGGPATAKGTVNPNGSFSFKKTRKTPTFTATRDFVTVEKEFTLYGSLAELNARYTIVYKNYGASCDVEGTLRKVADSYKDNQVN